MSKLESQTTAKSNDHDDVDEDDDQTNSAQKIVTNPSQPTDSEEKQTDQSNFNAENFVKTDFNAIIPKEHSSMIHCHVKRHRQGLTRIFSLFVEGQHSNDATCVLVARKHLTIGGHSEYFIGADEQNVANLNEDNSIAKLKSINLSSTEYILYHQQNSSNENQQTAAIIYDDHTFGARGPRKLTILLADQENKNLTLRNNETIIEYWSKGTSDGLIPLKNKPPTFNNELQIYTLDMKESRVKLPSHKNFQLVGSNEGDDIALQFGRIDENTFALDYRYPLTTIQAFAIALSSFHNRFRQ